MTPRLKRRVAYSWFPVGSQFGRALLMTIVIAGSAHPSGASILDVGVGAAEITPPVGFATGGHGPAGSIARGHLTRLYARAFFFRTSPSSNLLLVSVDAFAVPHTFRTRLHDSLSRAGVSIESASIVVAATHTHQGPGNFLATKLYNENGSAVSGFAPQLHEFLFRQILQAALAAIGDAQPSHLELRKGILPLSLALNRSPQTFMLNPNARELMTSFDEPLLRLPTTADACAAELLEGEPITEWRVPGCPRLRAIDRTISVLDIRRGERLAGALVFAAIHPTVMPASTPLYSGDFIGIAMRRLELSSEGAVFGFFNGPEGDIVPRRPRRDLLDLWNHATSFEMAIDSAEVVGHVNMKNGILARTYEARPGESREGAKLAPKPAPGVATLGGAEGDRTSLYDLGWRERVTALRSHKDQGIKLRALQSKLLPFPDLTWILAPPNSFSKTLPLSYIRLGELEILTTPNEMSTATGRLIKSQISGQSYKLIIGLANDYASYTATSAEYDMQDYMAASTFWGPDQAAFLAATLSALKATDLPFTTRPSNNPGSRTRSLAPYAIGQGYRSIDSGFDLIIRDLDGYPVRNLPVALWEECTTEDAFNATALRTVELWAGGVRLAGDSDGQVVIVLTRQEKRKLTWAAMWLRPVTGAAPPINLEFRIRPAHGEPLVVRASKADAPVAPSACQSSRSEPNRSRR